MRPRLLLFLTAAALHGASPLPAQAPSAALTASQPLEPSTGGDFDKPHGGWEYKYSAILTECPTVDPSNGHLRPGCFGERAEEDVSRQEVKALDRWLRGAILGALKLKQGYDTVIDILARGKALVNLVLNFGDSKPDLPKLATMRIADATDQMLRTASRVETSAQTVRLAGPVAERYAVADLVVLNALNQSADAHTFAQAMADQTSTMAERLGRGNVSRGAIGEAETTAPGDLPPLAMDATSADYATYVTSNTTALATVAAMAPGGPSRNPTPACPVPDDAGNMDPQVLFARAQTMAAGQQTSMIAAAAPLDETLNTVTTLQSIRREERHARPITSLMHFLFNF